jgi:cytochrome P450
MRSKYPERAGWNVRTWPQTSMYSGHAAAGSWEMTFFIELGTSKWLRAYGWAITGISCVNGGMAEPRSGFIVDPLSWLASASERGDFAVVDADGPVTTARARCTVAVFGPSAVRQVLSDLDTFGMPVSMSQRYGLPPVLANLNSALFSMTGPHHRSRQRLLVNCLGPTFAADHTAAIDAGIEEFLRGWRTGEQVPLLTETRRLARVVAQRVVLGTTGDDPIGGLIQRYFDLRRSYRSSNRASVPVRFDELVAAGTEVDRQLRAHVRTLRAGGDQPYSVLAHLCKQADTVSEDGMSEDELVAHANILFMSSSEPIATAMAWILLGLSQRARLRDALRAEGSLVHGVVNEFLRLVPPNALMVRVAGRATEVAGVAIEPETEVLISPFVEHRRANVFPDPLRVTPERWASARPGPFQFLPFGNGARSCLGRQIAQVTLERGTSALLARYDPSLPGPHRLGWRMNVTLLPAGDPLLLLAEPGMPVDPGVLSGPAAELLGC